MMAGGGRSAGEFVAVFALLALESSLGATAGAQAGAAQEIIAPKVAQPPRIDGRADDPSWREARELVVKIDAPFHIDAPRKKLSLKAVHDGEEVSFLLVWEDKTRNLMHDPFCWSEQEKKYILPEDNEIEDVATLAFPLAGEFNPDMLAGVESRWDVWEWQACRAGQGFARDKVHIYAKVKPDGVRSHKFTDRNGKPIFIARPEDEGTPCFEKLAGPPAAKEGEKSPQYVPRPPTGSCADVQAKGSWADGAWTVEFRRRLKTGHNDDAPFDLEKPVEFALATFDQAEHSDHEVSGKIILRFGK